MTGPVDPVDLVEIVANSPPVRGALFLAPNHGYGFLIFGHIFVDPMPGGERLRKWDTHSLD